MSERNWQEDWDKVEMHRHALGLVNGLSMHTMHGKAEHDHEVLAYWLQEIKSLREQLAQEKRRADEAEAKLTRAQM